MHVVTRVTGACALAALISFIPLQAQGMKARAEGVTSVKVLSKADADHLEGEGAKLTRNADGTANEISFVASGVELRKD